MRLILGEKSPKPGLPTSYELVFILFFTILNLSVEHRRRRRRRRRHRNLIVQCELI